MNGRVLSGRCLCGAVELRVPDAFEFSAYCHCSRCRQRSGAAFTVFGSIPLAQVSIARGEDSVLIASEDESGYCCFCKHCYSPLYAAVRERQYAHVQYGCLSDAPSLRPMMHIYVGSKAPWHDITDELPQYDELPP